MNSVVFEIASIRIKINSPVKGLIERFKEMYYQYIVNDTDNSDVTLDIQCVEMEQFINHEKLPFDANQHLIKTNYIYSSAYDPLNKKAILLTNLKNLYSFSEEYLLNLFSYVCLEQNKFLFHCAAIYDDHFNAYLFYGPSGIGKSTFVRNSTDYKSVSDDIVIIEHAGDDFFKIHKTPFERNKKKAIEEHHFKIKGFFRLNHAADLHIEKLKASQKITAILGNIWNLDFSKDTQEKYIELLQARFKNIPGYHLLLKGTNNLSEIISLLNKHP